MIAAYLRVSTEKQTLANQQNEIARFAESRNLHSRASNEARRHADRYRTVTAEPHPDRYHGNSGRPIEKRGTTVQHERPLRFRRHYKQQSFMLRIRSGRRNRAQPYLHAHTRSAGSAKDAGSSARTTERQLRKTATTRRLPHGNRR